MSLFSSIQLANNSLQAAQVGLQVAGQNIANANTPGYIREEVILSPQATQRDGSLLLGLGVHVDAIVQKLDKFLETRLNGAISDRASADAQEQTYLQLEGLVGELSSTDLSTSLNNFFNSISEVLNQPESEAVRSLAIFQGEALTGDFRRIADRVRQLSVDVNDRIINAAGDINRLIVEISELNGRVAATEGGDATPSDAVGLRDQRLVALSRLAELVDIKAIEQPDGTVSVYVGGDYLILTNTYREVTVSESSVDGLPRAEVRVSGIDSPIRAAGGALAGLIESRDQILGGFYDQYNELARTLAFEFNRVFSGGQGLQGFTSLTGEFAADDADVPLDQAGLAYTPVNGSFDVLVKNKQTGLTSTSTIVVDLNGLDDDLTLTELVAKFDSVDGISASITPTGRVSIAADGPNVEFAFADDTSGVLASLGINTFFSGSSVADLNVNKALQDNPALFAASRGGIGEDTETAIDLAAFLDRPLASVSGDSLARMYDRLIGRVTQGSTVAGSVAEGYRVFEATLEGQKLATSGVSLDEEAIQMIAFQRMYQASARYISILSELMEILVNL